MTRNRRALLIVISVGLAIVAWISLRRPADQTRILPDGTELSLRRVTFDRRHREVIGDRWLDQLGRWVPEGVAKRLGSQFVTAGETNELRFWLVSTGAGTNSGSRFRAVTIDRHGCELGLKSITEFPLGPGSQRALWTVGFKIFPRREPKVLLRILELSTNGVWVAVADYEVSNPGQREYPTWAAGSLPQTNRLEGVDSVLVKAAGGLIGGQGPAVAWKTGERPGIYARCSTTNSSCTSSATICPPIPS